MQKLLKTALLPILLLGLAWSAAGQDIPPVEEWEVLLYDSTQILIVNSTGIAGTLPLPAEAQNLANPNRITLQLSPDRRWLAFVSSAVGTLRIADLEEQTCCVAVGAPDGTTPDAIRLGAFSPDSARLAALYVYRPANPTQNRVAIIDVASGRVTQTAAPDDVLTEKGDFVAVDIVGWDASGLLSLSACLNCDGVGVGFFSAWNPETGAVIETRHYRSVTSDVLPATGEIIASYDNPDRPHSDAEVMGGPLNALRYTTLDDPSGGTEVFFDPNNLNLPVPRWVMDGNAYLLHRWRETMSTLVFRDGMARSMDYGVEMLFLTGTPDGWLMSNYQTGELLLYQWQDGQLGVNDLGLHAQNIRVLEAPDLGTTATGELVPVIGGQ